MPFPEKPYGLSPASLRLLDLAMTRAWLVEVAKGAAESQAEAAVCAELWAKVARIDDLRDGKKSYRSRKRNVDPAKGPRA